MEVEDKYSSVIRTKGVDQTWQDKQYGNQISS